MPFLTWPREHHFQRKVCQPKRPLPLRMWRPYDPKDSMNPENVRCPCSNARYVEVKLGQASLSPMTAAISSGDSGGQDHRNPMELSLFFPYALFLLVVLYFLSPLMVLREIPLSQLIPMPQGPFPKYIPLTLVHPAVYIKHLPSHLYTGVQVPRRVQLPFHRCLAGCSALCLHLCVPRPHHGHS